MALPGQVSGAALPAISHTIGACRTQQLHPASGWPHRPRPLHARGATPGVSQSPHWNLCKPGNIWLGKSKMNVPSIFPVPIPSSTKKTLNEVGRGASYQRQVCSENL